MDTVTLADIEQTCWRLTGYNGDQRIIDRLLAEVRAYAKAPTDEPCPCTVRSYLEPVSKAPSPPVNAPEHSFGAGAPSVEDTASQERTEPSKYATAVARPMREAGNGPGRTCRLCVRRWALEEYARDPKGPDGRRNACRDCENRRKREADAARRAARRAAGADTAPVRK